MDWTPWLPLISGVMTGALTGGIALLGIWGAMQRRLGGLEARTDNIERQQAEARDENTRLHREARAEYISLHENTRDENTRLHQEARAENARQHEETRAEFRRQISLVLQVMREHTHADGSPASIPAPLDVEGD